MREITYSLDGAELYVNLNDNGTVSIVYGMAEDWQALRDSSGADLPTTPSRNPLFSHAVDPDAAYRLLVQYGDTTEEDEEPDEEDEWVWPMPDPPR